MVCATCQPNVSGPELEANFEAVNNSVNQIRMATNQSRHGIHQCSHQCSFLQCVGGLVNAATAFDSIIDFGDINHLKVFLANDAALLAKVHEGLEKAKDIVDDAGQYVSDSKLKDVVFNEEDVVIGLVVEVALVRQPMVKQPNSGDNLGISPTHPPAITVGTGEAYEQCCGSG